MSQTKAGAPIRESAGAARRQRIGRVAFTPELSLSVCTVIVFLTVWVVVTTTGLVRPNVLPAPTELWRSLVQGTMNGYAGYPLYYHVWSSIARSMTGLAFGVLSGVPVGLLMGYFPRVNAALAPLFSFIRPMPAIAFIPLVILYFGIGEFPKILLIWIPCFLYMVLNTAAGVRAVPHNYVLTGLNLGLTRTALFVHVIVPSAMPFILNGVKIAAALAWAVVVAAELVAAQAGLGFLIMDAAIFFRLPFVYIGLIIIGIIGLLLEVVIVRIEGRVLHWARQ